MLSASKNDINLKSSPVINLQRPYIKAKKLPLTITFDIWSPKEVTVHRLCDCSQGVAGLQGVVAIVDVRRVLEGETALQVVLEVVHLRANVVVLLDLLLLVEPAQLGMGVAPHGELDAGVVAPLGLSQSQDDWRNWEEEKRKRLTSP